MPIAITAFRVCSRFGFFKNRAKKNMSNPFAHVLDAGKENDAATAPISASTRAGKRKSLVQSPSSHGNTVQLGAPAS
jgi:hypothetical protein